MLRGLQNLGQREGGFQTKHEISLQYFPSLTFPFVLGGAVVWTASFLVILDMGVFLLWPVQLIFLFEHEMHCIGGQRIVYVLFVAFLYIPFSALNFFSLQEF